MGHKEEEKGGEGRASGAAGLGSSVVFNASWIWASETSGLSTKIPETAGLGLPSNIQKYNESQREAQTEEMMRIGPHEKPD